MFPGLVQSVGRVSRFDAAASRLIITDAMAPLLVLGESIAVNGCCLSVVRRDEVSFDFDVGPESLARTNLGRLSEGDGVNLERALRMGDPLGGHLVSGHIDGVGSLAERIVTGDWQMLWFNCPGEFDDLLVAKGSIALDGVSLTLVDVMPGRFSVMVIPHTLSHTTLGGIEIGASVNLECDMIAKHVRKLFRNLTINL